MKRIIVLLIAMFLITGCVAKYNLVINEDLTVTEEARLTGNDDFFHNYYRTTKKNVLKDFIDIYQTILDDKKYQYEIKNDSTPYVFLTKEYSSVNDYVNNSILFNDYFDEIKYTENGNIKRIETIGYNPNEPDNPDRFDIKELEIAIKCPYKVKNHTATKVDKMTNTYYYELNENNDRILLEYDISSKFNPNEDLIKTIIICVVIILGIWILVYYFSKKNNKNI